MGGAANSRGNISSPGTHPAKGPLQLADMQAPCQSARTVPSLVRVYCLRFRVYGRTDSKSSFVFLLSETSSSLPNSSRIPWIWMQSWVTDVQGSSSVCRWWCRRKALTRRSKSPRYHSKLERGLSLKHVSSKSRRFRWCGQVTP